MNSLLSQWMQAIRSPAFLSPISSIYHVKTQHFGQIKSDIIFFHTLFHAEEEYMKTVMVCGHNYNSLTLM